jgi:hypothetical protein
VITKKLPTGSQPHFVAIEPLEELVAFHPWTNRLSYRKSNAPA